MNSIKYKKIDCDYAKLFVNSIKANILNIRCNNKLSNWSDEFNKSYIDLTKWFLRSGAYHNSYYMPEDSSNNAYQENGNLIIRNVLDHPTPDFDYSGAFIQTKDRFSFKYGRVEVRVKFPSDSPKYHATFWMMGNNYRDDRDWPRCGEIDLCEADNGTVTCTIHWADENNVHKQYSIGQLPVIANEYNVYSMEWTSDYIRIFANDRLYGQFDIDMANAGDYNAFRQPFWCMFNCNPKGTGDTYNDAPTVTCYIDYVRVYSE